MTKWTLFWAWGEGPELERLWPARAWALPAGELDPHLWLVRDAVRAARSGSGGGKIGLGTRAYPAGQWSEPGAAGLGALLEELGVKTAMGMGIQGNHAAALSAMEGLARAARKFGALAQAPMELFESGPGSRGAAMARFAQGLGAAAQARAIAGALAPSELSGVGIKKEARL